MTRPPVVPSAPRYEPNPNLRIASVVGDDDDGEATLIWDRPEPSKSDAAPRPGESPPARSVGDATPSRVETVDRAPGRRWPWVIGGAAVATMLLAVVTSAREQSGPAARARGTAPTAETPESSKAMVPEPTVIALPVIEPQTPAPTEDEIVVVVEDGELDGEERAEPSAARQVRRDPNGSRPGLAHRLANDGAVALTVGDRVSAIDLYQEALRANPSLASAAAGLSNAYFDQGRFDLAVEYAEQAVVADFDNAAHHVALGDAYYRTQAFDDARVQYETAVQLGSARAQRRLSKF